MGYVGTFETEDLAYKDDLVHGLHFKKGLVVFPSPAGMSLIKLSLGGNNLIFPAQGEFGQ
jgi:hypothetical protein